MKLWELLKTIVLSLKLFVLMLIYGDPYEELCNRETS